MQLFIALFALVILTVGLSELREWRSGKHFQMLLVNNKALRRQIELLRKEIERLAAESAEQSRVLLRLDQSTVELVERVAVANSFAEQAKTDLQTILTEYEVHGNLRHQIEAQRADFVEGL